MLKIAVLVWLTVNWIGCDCLFFIADIHTESEKPFLLLWSNKGQYKSVQDIIAGKNEKLETIDKYGDP